MVTAEANNGRTTTRNISYFKKVDWGDDSEDEFGDQHAEPEQQEELARRSKRIRNPVNRYSFDP